MRPLRLLLLLFCFIALPIFLTCLSIFNSRADSTKNLYTSRASRFQALFTFHAPSSLFYPSAIISLTYDNSTFFLARPAAFGPELPSKGLNGQLWVGRGFGDTTLSKDGQVSVAGWEFGCSDVPESERSAIQASTQEQTQNSVPKSIKPISDKDLMKKPENLKIERIQEEKNSYNEASSASTLEDGTDDYLHYPSSDSNPAVAGEPGEAANQEKAVDRNKKPTHADIESLQESAEIAGKIVLLSRGQCGFLEKVKWAQRRGGIAVIVGDDERGAQLTTMYARGDTSNITIPALFTSYTSAHLLSSLVPPEAFRESAGKKEGKHGESSKISGNVGQTEKATGPNFTPVKSTATMTSSNQPTIVPATDSSMKVHKGWVRNVLSSFGFSGHSRHVQNTAEDSRRPPSSGNINWVLLEEWAKEEDARDVPADAKVSNAAAGTASVMTSSIRTTSSRFNRPTSDDFVIGVQDWRDADLVAPKVNDDKKEGKTEGHIELKSSSVSSASHAPVKTNVLRGGSITPGSGEYKHEKYETNQNVDDGNSKHQKNSNTKARAAGEKGKIPARNRLTFWRSGAESTEVPASKNPKNRDSESIEEVHTGVDQGSQTNNDDNDDNNDDEHGDKDGHPGLWVTLTPANVSTSPFFDTLLVLVVSPLVTLTIVYALLLLRSRIRRRRWRAPKSVVERLPVRTYHTMSTSSSTTSSQVCSPHGSSATSPLLRSVSPGISRTRPRSQTTTGIMRNASAGPARSLSPVNSIALEKSKRKSGKRKQYAGRQVECVVCLEEYVDGESRVMSLPCGHEFHAECITPWLVTRRRTCPICKGDVVRSLAKGNGQSEDQTEPGEETADAVQDRAAETINESPTAAIPIPRSLDGDDPDVERGRDTGEPRSSSSREERMPRSAWRNIVGSVSALSGDTVWRNPTPRDRSQ